MDIDNSAETIKQEGLSASLQLPRKPERPLDSDCCGQGCVPCVLDLYEEELVIWKEECDRIKSGLTVDSTTQQSVEQSSGPVLVGTEYHTFQIEDVQQETEDSYRFRFSLPRGRTLGLQTGQHVVLRGVVGGETITRQYTPVSDISAASYFQLLIKVYADGRMSQLVKTWGVGTTVDIRGPFGNFLYLPNKYRMVLLLAVGTGIAPMCQVIQRILNNEEDEKLVYGCRTYKDILLQTELSEWRKYWNFSHLFCLSQESKKDGATPYKYGEKIHNGRIDKDVVLSELGGRTDNILVLICGTRSFEKDMLNLMPDIGVASSQYHKF